MHVAGPWRCLAAPSSARPVCAGPCSSLPGPGHRAARCWAPPAAAPLPARRGLVPGPRQVAVRRGSARCPRLGLCRAPRPPAPLPLRRGGCPTPTPSALLPAREIVKGSKGLADSPRLLPSRRPGRSPFPGLLGVVHMPVPTAELVGGNLAAAVGTVVKCFTEIQACCIYHFSFCLL